MTSPEYGPRPDPSAEAEKAAADTEKKLERARSAPDTDRPGTPDAAGRPAVGLTASEAGRQIESIEKVVGPLPAETKKAILDNTAAKNSAERKGSERGHSLKLLENLGLGEGEGGKIEAAREAIRAKDPTGEKMKIFDQALEYFSSAAPVAETPVYHSTGSYSLAKIIEHGALESKRNAVTGEHANTGEVRGSTSLAVGGYPSSEVVSRAYARMNERVSRLQLDQSDITGVGAAEDIVRTVFAEIPRLPPSEQAQVRRYIAEMKKSQGKEGQSDEEFMAFKMEDVAERKYYYDPAHAQQQIDGLKAQIGEAEARGQDRAVERLTGLLARAEERVRGYESETAEMQQEMVDPFPVMLIYEGKQLPAADLNTTVGGLIAERRTGVPLANSELRQISVPLDSVDKARTWLKKRAENLPAGSPERQALETVKIVPMEYLEAKRIISG